MRFAIVLFDGAEELDWAGPWEVLAAWAKQYPDDGVEVYTVAETLEPVTCANGLRVLADHTWADAPAPDVVVWPGVWGRAPSSATLRSASACATSPTAAR